MNRRALPLVLAAGLTLTGCFGSKAPVTTVWTLPAPKAQVPGVDPDGPALGVDRFASAAELRTTSLTYREGDGRQIKRYPSDVWSDYPDRILRERLIARLLAERAFKSVTEAPPRRGLDAVLSLRLVEFGEWDSPDAISVRVAVRWTLSDPEGEVLDSDLARSEQPADKSVERVISAYEAATDEVLGSIARRVAERLDQD